MRRRKSRGKPLIKCVNSTNAELNEDDRRQCSEKSATDRGNYSLSITLLWYYGAVAIEVVVAFDNR